MLSTTIHFDLGEKVLPPKFTSSVGCLLHLLSQSPDCMLNTESSSPHLRPHDQYSVLDKIVPGYYHRRMEDGDICQSTCCNNTATENLMMERLIIDDMVHWAKRYRIDGFRFDIMGHLLVSTMNKIRSSLDQLTLEADGVDGRSIYIYGEAWDFGEMVENQRGVNASQQNLSGTGLGAFNDRIRDGALGGGPFAPYHTQGLVTGLALTPNQISLSQGSNETMMKELLELTDWVRWSLAGNLRDYRTEAYDGESSLFSPPVGA